MRTMGGGNEEDGESHDERASCIVFVLPPEALVVVGC